jgi:hypothetical protein
MQEGITERLQRTRDADAAIVSDRFRFQLRTNCRTERVATFDICTPREAKSDDGVAGRSITAWFSSPPRQTTCLRDVLAMLGSGTLGRSVRGSRASGARPIVASRRAGGQIASKSIERRHLEVRQLRMQNITRRLTRRSAVRCFDCLARQLIFRMLWKVSIFLRCAYQFGFSVACRRDVIGRSARSLRSVQSRSRGLPRSVACRAVRLQ